MNQKTLEGDGMQEMWLDACLILSRKLFVRLFAQYILLNLTERKLPPLKPLSPQNYPLENPLPPKVFNKVKRVRSIHIMKRYTVRGCVSELSHCTLQTIRLESMM